MSVASRKRFNEKRSQERAAARGESHASITERARILEIENRRLKGQALHAAMVRDEIIKVSHAKPPIPKWTIGTKPRAAKSPGIPSLFLSDLHWGEVVDPAQIGGVNEYSLEIAHRRLRTLVGNSIDLLRNHMACPTYDGIVVILGGDMVSGDIHEELSQTNQEPMMPVLLDLLGAMIWAITHLADEFGAVFVPCVTGNHSRTTAKPRAKDRNHTSYDWLLYQLLDRHFANDERVTFLIPDGPDCLFRIWNHRYLVTHGDQFKGGDGMIGALGPIIRGDHRKRSRNGQIGQAYDTLLVAHWHQLIQMQRLIVNGSLKGYDEYANTWNFGFEQPRQAMWITHPSRGITYQIPIQVETEQKGEDAYWVSVPKRDIG